MSQTVHPFINMLVNRIKIIDDLYIKGNYAEAWNIMINIIDTLRPADQEKAQPFKQELEKNIQHLDTKRGLTPLDTYSKKAAAQDRLFTKNAKQYKQIFINIIWSGNYLENKGYNSLTLEELRDEEGFTEG